MATPSLRAAARNANRRSSIFSSRAGSNSSASRAASSWACASIASLSARSSAASALSRRPMALSTLRSIRRCAVRSAVAAPRPCSSSASAWATASPNAPPARSSCRSPANVSSSSGLGDSTASSFTAWRRKSSSRRAAAAAASASACACSALRQACQAARTASPCFSSPAKASRDARWVAMSKRPCCSIWPWISTSVSPSRRSRATDTGWSLTKARPRPSAPTRRRSVSASSSSSACSASTARAGWSLGRSNEAATDAWLAPRRTAPDSARAPKARPSASIRIDLPAPVSPVSAPSPPVAAAPELREKFKSSFSIRTKSRIESETSMQARSEQAEEPAALLVGRRRAALAGHQVVAVLIPVAARKVVAQHRRRLLRLAFHAERQVALDQAVQRLGHVGGGLVALDHDAIAVDRPDILLVLLVVAADRHLLAGEMADGELDLEARVAGVGRFGEALDDFGQGVERLLGDALVAADVGDLLVVAQRLQIVGIRNVTMAGMELDEAVERDDGLVVLVRLVVGEGSHDLGLGRTHRVRVLAVDFLEALRGGLVFLLPEVIEGAVVENLDRLLDVVRVVVRGATAAKPERRQTERQPGDRAASLT